MKLSSTFNERRENIWISEETEIKMNFGKTWKTNENDIPIIDFKLEKKEE